MSKKQYDVLDSIQCDHVDYVAGDTLELTDATARQLLKLGVIKLSKVKPSKIKEKVKDKDQGETRGEAEKESGKKEPKEEAGNAPDDPIADLVAMIGRLDPENPDHYTKSGKPEVKALSKLAGRAVSGADRDTAWAAYQPSE